MVLAIADARLAPTPTRSGEPASGAAPPLVRPRCAGCRSPLGPRRSRWCSDRCRLRVRARERQAARPVGAIIHAPACEQCSGPIPSTRSTVPRRFCSDRCRGQAYRLAHLDAARAQQERYRAKVKASGRTPWYRTWATATFDALARRDGVPQRALRCQQCRSELGALVAQPDGRQFLLVGGSGRVVVALDPNGRDHLRVECPRCGVFRAVAARAALLPASSLPSTRAEAATLIAGAGR